MPFLPPSLLGCPLADWLTAALPVWIPPLPLLRRQLEMVVFKNSTQPGGRGCSRAHVLREMKVSAHILAVSEAPALSTEQSTGTRGLSCCSHNPPMLLLHSSLHTQELCSNPPDVSGRGFLLLKIQLSPSRAGLMRRHQTPHKEPFRRR